MTTDRQLPLACAFALLAACLEPPPEVDLDSPTLLSSTLSTPRSVEVPVSPVIDLALSEPLDPSTVSRDAIALLAWEEAGSCALTPLCEEGSCERGHCLVDPVRSKDRSALDKGEFAGGIELEIELLEGPGGPDSLLRIRPRRPLQAHWRHSLILGAGLRDRAGVGLVPIQRDFVTAAAGSSGPEPILVSPRPGEPAVPTNLAFVELRFSPPIPAEQGDATIGLEAEDGSRVELIEPETCARWPAGTCLRMHPAAPLRPHTRYRPAAGTVVDRLGRAAILPAAERETWFETGSGPDLDTPDPEVIVTWRGRCLVAWIDSAEVLDAKLEVDDRSHETSTTIGWTPLGVLLDAYQPGDSVAWQLELIDRAGNPHTLEGQLRAGPAFAPELPRIAITEILANPLGPEPDAEFVELLALAPADTTGVLLSDLPFETIVETKLVGDEPKADPLPSVQLVPGQPAILVSSKWSAQLGDDPPPSANTPVLVLDASLASSGLKNAGEPLTLWIDAEQGPQLVASYGNWIDTGAKLHEGRSVIADPLACDLPERWRSHPLASSTPGTLP